MNHPISLHTAKNQLDKAVRAVACYMLHPVDSRVSDRRYVDQQSTDNNPLALSRQKAANDLYYFHSTAANQSTFVKRVTQVTFLFPALREDAQFQAMVNTATAHYITVELLAAEEKNRLTAKRATVAAKRDLKAELNLQEGVKLAGVDVGQYKVILAGLEPIRLHVYEVTKINLRRDVKDVTSLLAVHHFDVSKANPSDYHTHADRSSRKVAYEKYRELQSRITKWYDIDSNKIATSRTDNVGRIEREAKQTALAYVQGYAVKLAQKVGEVIANDPKLSDCVVLGASVSSTTLWQDSIAELTLEHRGSLLADDVRFHTQIIWNRSCLGKVFNQYPTRRMV